MGGSKPSSSALIQIMLRVSKSISSIISASQIVDVGRLVFYFFLFLFSERAAILVYNVFLLLTSCSFHFRSESYLDFDRRRSRIECLMHWSLYLVDRVWRWS